MVSLPLRAPDLVKHPTCCAARRGPQHAFQVYVFHRRKEAIDYVCPRRLPFVRTVKKTNENASRLLWFPKKRHHLIVPVLTSFILASNHTTTRFPSSTSMHTHQGVPSLRPRARSRRLYYSSSSGVSAGPHPPDPHLRQARSLRGCIIIARVPKPPNCRPEATFKQFN